MQNVHGKMHYFFSLLQLSYPPIRISWVVLVKWIFFVLALLHIYSVYK